MNTEDRQIVASLKTKRKELEDQLHKVDLALDAFDAPYSKRTRNVDNSKIAREALLHAASTGWVMVKDAMDGSDVPMGTAYSTANRLVAEGELEMKPEYNGIKTRHYRVKVEGL